MRILIAEDDPGSRELLRRFLISRGHEVVAVANGVEALERFSAEGADLLLLDVMMPRVDGWAVLEEIRKSSSVPVIMVTVKDSTEEKVRGLQLGADDYVTKPFDLRELEARIAAVTRRVLPGPRLKLGEILIDDEKKEVRVRGKVVELSPKEYELLRLLASRPGKVFSHREILEKIWAGSSFASSEDVKKYIYLLRNKIEEDPEEPRLVLTVRGFGYKLAAGGEGS
ncbi:TPA: response regulator transcription factor [Candidatus Bipolaricaulota bacterium]|nr:response regulator transcription factor [Candidatus Bipolaricaulota bacterium]